MKEYKKVPSFIFRLYLSRREAKLILNRLALTEEEMEEKPWKRRLKNNLLYLVKHVKNNKDTNGD
tara:strand:- start:407 stop:601 length:195 start_codon:yes stop_codon:yes gene_type:complete